MELKIDIGNPNGERVQGICYVCQIYRIGSLMRLLRAEKGCKPMLSKTCLVNLTLSRKIPLEAEKHLFVGMSFESYGTTKRPVRLKRVRVKSTRLS